MYYDTVQFGIRVKAIRQNLKLTQKEVVEQTGITENTIRRLENGKVLPKQETLDLLSVTYKQDVSQLFLSCRIKDFGKYNDIMEEIDKASEASDPEWLSKCLTELQEMSKTEMNDYYKLILNQTIILLKGSIQLLNDTQYDVAHKYFTDGLQITLEDFDYHNYKEHTYTKLELQLLMNLSSAEHHLCNKALAIDLIDQCVHVINTTPDLKVGYLPTKIYLNASYTNYLSRHFQKSLRLASEGIEYNKSTRSQYASGHLYARKGFAELYLKCPPSLYMDSFKKAYFYHEILDQQKLQKILVNTLKERHDIDLLKVL